jgi:molecular chaperone GrpE
MYCANDRMGRYHNPLRYELELSRQSSSRSDSEAYERYVPAIEDLKNRLKEYESLYLRQRAEMENYTRAKEKEVSRIVLNASHEVIRNMLPVMDSIDSAIKSSKNGDDFLAIRKTLFLSPIPLYYYPSIITLVSQKYM